MNKNKYSVYTFWTHNVVFAGQAHSTKMTMRHQYRADQTKSSQRWSTFLLRLICYTSPQASACQFISLSAGAIDSIIRPHNAHDDVLHHLRSTLSV